MSQEQLDALRKASQENADLHAALEGAASVQEWLDVAKAHGYEVAVADLPTDDGGQDISDTELEAVSGGYTFPATDWIYCDNPWTNYWCTLRC